MSKPGHLLWRCRRGMVELDRVLGLYLEGPYERADASERRAFESLLELQDDLLWHYLIGRVEPEDRDLAALIGKISPLAVHRA